VLACRPAVEEPCGAFYFVRSHIALSMLDIRSAIQIHGDRTVWYPIPTTEAIDVDCHADWKLAELILEDRERGQTV
jgi:CMP-N-acetylneuraminic acid synthetase